jgi:PST family polysaccharide transporter
MPNMKSATSAIKWTSASQGGRLFLQWVTVAILARLLSPGDFGQVGIAIVVIGFIILFRDLGTSASVIQRKDISDPLLSSLFWVNVGFGFVATLVIFLISPLVGLLYHDPEITNLLRLLSVTFFISGFGIIQQAILERNLKFNILAKVEVIAAALGSIVGIFAALSGFGAWSLVYQVLVTTSATTISLLILCRWKPKAYFSFIEVKKITSFSLNLTGFNIINYFSRNADNLLIGYFLGVEALGYYNLAYRLMLLPLLNVTYVINRVILPLYSRIQDDNARLRSMFLRISGATAFITFPLMIGLVALREPFINLIFGSKWSPVIILVLILAPVGMVQSIMSSTGVIYTVKCRTDWLFRWGIGSGLFVIISFIVGLSWGIEGVAIAYAIATAILTYPCFAIPFKLIDMRVRNLATVLWQPFSSGLVMLVCVYGVKATLTSGEPGWFSFGALIFLGVVVYLMVSWLINRDQFNKMIEMFGVRV